MTRLTKFSLVAIAVLGVAWSFALAPVHAAQTKALGMIMDSQGGRIGSAPASAGSSVFVGDILNTDTDGHLTVRIGQTTYQLLGDTTVVFYAGQSSPIAELRHGAINISNNSATEGFRNFRLGRAYRFRLGPSDSRRGQSQVAL